MKINFSNQFKKDIKHLTRQNKDVLKIFNIMVLLNDGKPLDKKYEDYLLLGEYTGYRECHIESDWLLIYKVSPDNKEIVFDRTGSHSNLFDKY